VAVSVRIKPGARVLIRTAFGDQVEGRALSGVEKGHTFPVVRVCREEEWNDAERRGADPEGFAVPAEDVSLR
jgi:hypothetical protein